MKSSFWLSLLCVSIYAMIKFVAYFTCADLPLNGVEILILIVFTGFFTHKFIITSFLSLSKDHRGGLFGILMVAYAIFILGLSRDNQIRDLKENGGIVITAKIIRKIPSQKSDQEIRVVFTNSGETDSKSMSVSVQDFKKKHRSDTILLLYSSTCSSTGIAYDLYPSKSDIKKCLNGCEFVYGKEGLTKIKSSKQN
ncbi:hypothetical protein [Marivirga sericea]|nr:hypothetical protein [Marivirga sericea]